jgi:hypothetical protein
MKRRAATGILLALIFGGVGALWLSELSPNHSACSSALIAAVNQSACQGDNLRWYGAWALIALGVLCAIMALIDYSKESSAPVRNCSMCSTTMNATANNCSNCGAVLS